MKRILSILLTVSLLGFLVFSILSNLEAVQTFSWNLKFSNLLLTFLFAIPIYFINVLSWHLTLRSLNVSIRYIDSLQIWVFSNLSRFIPGFIWQYASRIYLAKKKGISPVLSSASLIIEAIFTLFVGSLIVFLTLNSNFVITSLIILIAVILVLVYPTSFSLIYKTLKKFTHKNQALNLRGLPIKWVPLLIISFSFQFIIDGSLLYFLSKNAINLDLSQYPLFIGIFAASWLIGYISIFAPSGLGVQELSIATLLSNFMPLSIASVIAILFRICLLISELMTFLLILILKKVLD